MQALSEIDSVVIRSPFKQVMSVIMDISTPMFVFPLESVLGFVPQLYKLKVRNEHANFHFPIFDKKTSASDLFERNDSLMVEILKNLTDRAPLAASLRTTCISRGHRTESETYQTRDFLLDKRSNVKESVNAMISNLKEDSEKPYSLISMRPGKSRIDEIYLSVTFRAMSDY